MLADFPTVEAKWAVPVFLWSPLCNYSVIVWQQKSLDSSRRTQSSLVCGHMLRGEWALVLSVRLAFFSTSIFCLSVLHRRRLGLQARDKNCLLGFQMCSSSSASLWPSSVWRYAGLTIQKKHLISLEKHDTLHLMMFCWWAPWCIDMISTSTRVLRSGTTWKNVSVYIKCAIYRWRKSLFFCFFLVLMSYLAAGSSRSHVALI